MFDYITVETALKRGNRTITIPSIIMMFVMIIISIIITVNSLVPYWFLPIIYLSSLALPWLYWSYKIVDWRLWAFEKVRNVHELKKRAIQETLISNDRSFFSKTEIWTKEQRKQWDIIAEKFKLSDIFIDDLSIPKITLIGYSKVTNLFEAGLFIFLFLVGFFFSVFTDSYAGGAITGFFGILIAYRIYTRYQSANNTETQISISNKGIETKSIPIQNWNVIKNESTITEGGFRYSKNYLIFDYPEGHAKIDIDYLATSGRALNKILRVYRARFNNEHNLE